MKKNIYGFLIKNTVISWTQNSKTCTNCQATYEEELLFAVWKIREFFFHRANVQIGLTNFSPCSFLLTLCGPSPSMANVHFECSLLVQKVIAGKPNVRGRRCNQKTSEIIFAYDIFASYDIFLLFLQI